MQLNNITEIALCEVALSDGSDLVVGEEMKIGMELYIHYILELE